MVLSSVLRALVRSASSSAFCVVSTAGVALTLSATPAAASHPKHHATQHTGKHTAAKTAGSAKHASAKHAARHASKHASKHAAKHERRAAARRHRAAEHRATDVAEATPVPLYIPQFALPDLAVAAATHPAGRTLGGFGGPNETAMVPAAAAPRTLAAITRSASSLLESLVSRARGQLGTRYVFGGAEPGAGLDCSSFARYAMEALGIRLPRTANQQAQIGRAIPRDPSLLRPGDLLTFGSRSHVSHVGIYLGQGRFIHASVKHGEVIETTIDRNRSLFRRWQGARRLLASVDDSANGQSTQGG